MLADFWVNFLFSPFSQPYGTVVDVAVDVAVDIVDAVVIGGDRSTLLLWDWLLPKVYELHCSNVDDDDDDDDIGDGCKFCWVACIIWLLCDWLLPNV